jgi:TRAP-type uncharacterized transport system substrate-binding protein
MIAALEREVAMRFIPTAALALLVAAPAGAADEATVRIASGVPGGTYRDIYAKNLEAELTGVRVKQLETTGSGENFELLVARKADLAFVQADVFATRTSEEPYLLEGLSVLGTLSNECVYIARRKDGAVQSVQALGEPVEGRSARVSIGPDEGGMSGSWDYLVTLEPSLSEATLNSDPGAVALGKLGSGELDAVAWVTDPSNLDHDLLRRVREDRALELMPLDDPQFASVLPDGTQVYRLETVETSPRRLAPGKLATVCTSALLVAQRDADPKVVEKVQTLLRDERERIVKAR